MLDVSSQLEDARKQLLDLGFRNPLLNYRLLRARGVKIVEERSADIYNLLVNKNKRMTFDPAVDEPDTSEESKESEEDEEKEDGSEQIHSPILDQFFDEDKQDDDLDSTDLKRYTDTKLQTAHPNSELQKRLLQTYYQAKTYIEAQGVNTLYIALGMLYWYEDENSEKVRVSPLILIPVQLDRKDVNAQFRVFYDGDEVVDNLSLQEKVKRDFGLTFPVWEDYTDVVTYFEAVTQAISNKPRWRVESDAIALGLFSFASLLMYRDLDGASWPKGDSPAEHKTVQALLGQGFREPQSSYDDKTFIDEHVTPENSHQVVSADSSQTLALLDVNSGRNLVIQGPPGTGKSQTITNIIAEAIGANRTVLFVSEKMAALEVVKRRLDTVGLGDACLELHSHKTNKKHFLGELKRTVELGQPKRNEVQEIQGQRKLVKEQETLNRHSVRINSAVGNSQKTVYQLYGHLLAQPDLDLPKLQIDGMSQWDDAAFETAIDEVETLQLLISKIGSPPNHSMWGSELTSLTPAQKREIRESCQVALASLAQIESASKPLQSVAGVAGERLDTAAKQLTSAQRVANAPDLNGVNVGATAWKSEHDKIVTAIEHCERDEQLRSTYADVVIPEAWSHDILETRKALVSYGRKWWRIFSGKYRAAKSDLRGLCASEMPSDIDTQIAISEAILEVKRIQSELAADKSKLETLFGADWKERDWESLRHTTNWLNAVHNDVSNGTISPDVLASLTSNNNAQSSEWKASISTLENALKQYPQQTQKVINQLAINETVRFGATRFIELPRSEQRELLSSWMDQLDTVQDIISFNVIAKRVRDLGLEQVIHVALTWSEAGKHLCDLVTRNWHEYLLEVAQSNDTSISGFSGLLHTENVNRFQTLDEQLFQHNRVQLVQKHWEQLPRGDSSNGQVGILKREFHKKSRHKPIRKLMKESGHVIQRIKPVFMMSPMSIAMYLPASAIEFDLVVFDEASQVRPSEAIGAILRCKQVVVVGDEKQLPPTNFFRKLGSEELEEDAESVSDFESILDLFVAQNAPERMLRWHYRSRHQSLIAVSNHEFYDSRLVIFPSPDMGGTRLGLIYHYAPDTIYESGTTATNPLEALQVAQAVMHHAKTKPSTTLGVVSFSQKQMQAILDQLEVLRKQDESCENFFNSHTHEPFFVKNLENVQGDERDVIFISIGYGRRADGRVLQNFGPLNRQGGERRLNVLITRARMRCEIFTNMRADDIKQSDKRGVISLKRYLKYAETGSLDLPQPTGKEADSPFESAVADAIRKAGYEVHHQIGSGGFYIDLAVIDPNAEGRYLLAIECDGATYHSSRSARDRDKLRQQVLEGLGWKFHRIWSTDWFSNPKREVERIVQAIERAQVSSSLLKKKKKSEPTKVIARSDNLPVIESPVQKSVPYQIATKKFDTGNRDFHEVHPNTLANWIRDVVAVETPIHIDEAIKRVRTLAGVTRTGNRIKSTMQNGIKTAIRQEMIARDKNFLLSPNQQGEIVVRDRSTLPNAPRKIELIYKQEIAMAILQVVREGVGMLPDDIPPAVCKLLGMRAGQNAKERIMNILTSMINHGQLKRNGDYVIIENKS